MKRTTQLTKGKKENWNRLEGTSIKRTTWRQTQEGEKDSSRVKGKKKQWTLLRCQGKLEV